MIVTKTHLSRRTILRGLGAAVALPFLDAMVPAFAAGTAATPVRRLSSVFLGNGMNMSQWTPRSVGELKLSPTLQPLAAYQDRLVVLSGFDNTEAFGSDGGPHPREQTSWLTGARAKRTEGPGIQAGTSMDQIAARQFGRDTQLASLELAIEAEALGACSNGYSCVYQNTLSWRTDTQPLPMENNPRAVFERLFGVSESTDPQVRLAVMRKEQSILDSVTQKVASLQKDLGAVDRTRLTEYLDAVRDVERRIRKSEEQASVELPVLDQPAGIPGNYDEHAKLMFDLQVLAYQCDLTRVITFMMARGGSHRSYAEIGVPDAHHPLSHHGNNPEKLARLAKLNVFHLTMFEYFLQRLDAVPDGDGTLLDHTLILLGCGMSDPSPHEVTNVPTVVVGGNGTLFGVKGGRHVQMPKGTPLTNLQLTLLDRMGVRVDHFGNSAGELALVADL